MSIERRVEKLEQDSNGDEITAIVVTWDEREIAPDKVVTLSNGLMMTFAEFERRYPEAALTQIVITWREDDEITSETITKE